MTLRRAGDEHQGCGYDPSLLVLQSMCSLLQRENELPEGPVLIGVHANYRDNHVRLCVSKTASSDGFGCINLLDFII